MALKETEAAQTLAQRKDRNSSVHQNNHNVSWRKEHLGKHFRPDCKLNLLRWLFIERKTNWSKYFDNWYTAPKKYIFQKAHHCTKGKWITKTSMFTTKGIYTFRDKAQLDLMEPWFEQLFVLIRWVKPF